MKLALLVGINYIGQRGELHGCVNDADQVRSMLVGELGYAPENVLSLTDTHGDPPTKENILKELIALAQRSHDAKSEPVDEIFFHYSGHGTYIQDHSGDEDDARDECLVPVDYAKSGLITDDTLNSVLALVNPSTRFVGVIDACHSETAFDLPFRYVAGNKHVIESTVSKIVCNAIMISGCRDTQTSTDAYNLENSSMYSGAMTTAFRATLKVHNYTVTVWQLLKHMRRFLKKRKFKQVPQVTTNVRLDRSTLFVNRADVAFIHL
jgi:hypothetical protein